MGERENNRRAYEAVTRRLVEHSQRQGKPMSDGEARKIAGQGARESDAKRDAGEFKKRGKR